MPWINLSKAQYRSVITYIVITFICGGLYIFSYAFDVYEGGSDNYAHYFISKYSWDYPYLLLDHWGKPIFSLLTSLFAQFGIRGIIFFNCIIGGITAIFSYKIASFYSKSLAFIVPLFLLFSPIFSVLMMSAMTEILASSILVIGIYMYYKQYFRTGSTLLSGLLLVRTELALLLLFFSIFLLIIRQVKSIPYLAVMPLIYSIIGGFYYKDFFWIYTNIPYLNPTDSYGKGSIFHYLLNFHILLGWPFLIFLVAGMFSTFLKLKTKSIQQSNSLMLLTLITVSWLALLAAHSYVYFSGGKASLGLLRVLAPVIPLMSISAAIGFKNLFFCHQNIFPFHKTFIIRNIMICLVIFFQLIQPWTRLPIPYKYDENERTMMAALECLKKYSDEHIKIRYFDVFVPFYLNIDPYNSEKCIEGIHNKSNPFAEIDTNEIIVYDTRFGANEWGIHPNIFVKSTRLRLINYFEPIVPYITLNNLEYKIYIFEKKSVLPYQNIHLLDSLIKSKYNVKTELFKFDNYYLVGDQEYFGILEELISNFNINYNPNILHIRIDDFHNTYSTDGLDFCVSLESNNSIKHFFSIPLSQILDRGYHDFYVNKLEGEYIKFFIWNTTRQVRECKLFTVRAELVNKSY